MGHGWGTADELVPRRVGALVGKRVVQVAGVPLHTAVVTSDGELYTFGDGYYGKLGHGNQTNELVPRWVEACGEKYAVQVACGRRHTAVITSMGELFTFGSGYYGKLGHGNSKDDEFIPRRVEALVGKRVVQVACGGND